MPSDNRWFKKSYRRAICPNIRRTRSGDLSMHVVVESFATVPIDSFPPQFQPQELALIHMRELRVHNLPRLVAENDLAGSTVIVIDVLRASTTIAQALAAGAIEVVPFLKVSDTLAAAAADRANVMLGGERGGRRIDGFDLGNSPSEYTPQAVAGRRVLLTTTNGTCALHHARLAHRVLIGSFLNLSVVAESLKTEPRVDVLCAGTDGRESREDILAAGAIVDNLCRRDEAAWNLNDAAVAARREWQSRGGDLVAELRTAPGGKNLSAIGLDQDIVDCARIDLLNVVPEFDIATLRITLP
jgi:2-phosphosulfolactate phosphatase